MIPRTRRVLAALATLGLLACTGTEVGNPVEGSELTLLVDSSTEGVLIAPEGAVADAANATTIIHEAWVVLGDLRFVLDDDCARDMDTRVTVEGPLVVELVGDPTTLSALIAGDDYCRIRVPMIPTPPEDDAGVQPEQLQAHSLLLVGEHAGLPFQIRSSRRFELQLRSKDEPFRIEEGSGLILAFDAARWLDGVDLDSATPDVGGTIQIDWDHGRDLLRAFEDNVDASLKLYRDVNDNGELDGNERDEPLAL